MRTTLEGRIQGKNGCGRPTTIIIIIIIITKEYFLSLAELKKKLLEHFTEVK